MTNGIYHPLAAVPHPLPLQFKAGYPPKRQHLEITKLMY